MKYYNSTGISGSPSPNVFATLADKTVQLNKSKSKYRYGLLK
jgi:hypothetical protein